MLLTRNSRQRGYGVEVRAYGPNREVDSIQCAHCGETVWDDEPRVGKDPADLGGRCTCCDNFICVGCRGKPCMPLEMRLEQWERRNQGLRYVPLEEIYEIFYGRANGQLQTSLPPRRR